MSELEDLIAFIARATVGHNPSAKQKNVIQRIRTLLLSLYRDRADNDFDRAQSQKPSVRNIRDRQLREKYGITLDDWEKMFLAQSSACAICKCTNPGRQWHTDHCHRTGNVRGILCHGCNTGLGYFCDSSAALQSAVTYLDIAAKNAIIA
jgi:hypothetical protein